jgi:hypothetical protein
VALREQARGKPRTAARVAQCRRRPSAARAHTHDASPRSRTPQGSGLSWLFPFQDGAPPIGWHDAGAYLVLPVLLVVSQFVSQKMVSPQSSDPAQQQTQAILKFIPFMIGAGPAGGGGGGVGRG